MRKGTLAFLSFVMALPVFAQTDSVKQKIYRVKPQYELPGAAAGVVLSTLGFRQLEKISNMSAADVQKLNPANINAFDRPIAFLDPAGFEQADKRSDLYLNIALFSPLLLGLDKEIRKDWVDLLSLYLMTHATDNAIYFISGFSVRRPRPLTYNPLVDIDTKTGNGKSNSFFSGHTSFSSAATFFMAKVYTDYHHIRGWNRALVYTAAAIPPALVGYYRMRAGKHFKTDVMLGLLVGATSGILVPELHRNKNKRRPLSMIPYYQNGIGGISMAMKF